ncbi:hypothetical protein MMC22_006319 [Lobaria immixta]|nr:hypothetical protein [Lobaria immixta]
MPITQLPPAEHLGSLSNAERAAILDLLFEPSDTIHTLIEVLSEGSSYEKVIDGIRAELSRWADNAPTGDSRLLDDVLASHPRLGEQKVDSQQSRAEQAQLQTDIGTDGDTLSRLNSLYEETFPGLRYVVFVNGRSRAVIVEDIRARINRGDIQRERHEAINGICDIAADRAQKLGTVDIILWKNANRVSQLSESTPG